MGCRPALRDPEAPRPPPGRPALFLDRDGVVNVERNYVSRVDEFELVCGVLELCRAAAAREHPIVIVTNQAGIGRGLYGEAEFATLTHFMLGELRAAGAPAAGVYWCPHHPTAGVGAYRADCPCRKPAPGMLLAARDDLGIDLAASALVGDKATDVEAGARAGVGRLVLLGASGGAGALPEGAATVPTLAEARALLYGPA